MKRPTIRERDQVEIGPDGDLTDTQADGLGQLAHRLPNGALTWGHRTVRFGPFCGVIRTKHVTIELLPKVEHGPQDSETMRGLLVAMLAKAGELGVKKVGVADLGHQSSDLLDVFIEDFCNQVKAALQGGAIARYSETTESLNAIRGRLELTNTPLIEAAEKARTVEGIGSQRLEGLRALLLPQRFHRRGCKSDAP